MKGNLQGFLGYKASTVINFGRTDERIQERQL